MKIENKNNNTYRVAAGVVTYGSRLSLLTQTVTAILHDKHISKLFIIDNASVDGDAITREMAQYGDRVHIIRHTKNLGSAGGFAHALEVAREEDVDYVYLSDDDVIISPDFVESFRTAHKVIGNDQTVLLARRKSFWAGTDVHYSPDVRSRPRSYFNIFDPRIAFIFIKSILRMEEKHVTHDSANFFPLVPSFGWAYAGSLLPIQAVKNTPLPVTSLGLYLDDLVYSWGIIDAGYLSFALTEPHLVDLEMTHADAHTATGLSSSAVSQTKIYYETRNRVRVSLLYGNSSPLWLRVRVVIWCIGVGILSVFRYGIHTHTVLRMNLIIEALRAGFDPTRLIPDEISVKI